MIWLLIIVYVCLLIVVLRFLRSLTECEDVRHSPNANEPPPCRKRRCCPRRWSSKGQTPCPLPIPDSTLRGDTSPVSSPVDPPILAAEDQPEVRPHLNETAPKPSSLVYTEGLVRRMIHSPAKILDVVALPWYVPPRLLYVTEAGLHLVIGTETVGMIETNIKVEALAYLKAECEALSSEGQSLTLLAVSQGQGYITRANLETATFLRFEAVDAIKDVQGVETRGREIIWSQRPPQRQRTFDLCHIRVTTEIQA